MLEWRLDGYLLVCPDVVDGDTAADGVVVDGVVVDAAVVDADAYVDCVAVNAAAAVDDAVVDVVAYVAADAVVDVADASTQHVLGLPVLLVHQPVGPFLEVQQTAQGYDYGTLEHLTH